MPHTLKSICLEQVEYLELLAGADWYGKNVGCFPPTT